MSPCTERARFRRHAILSVQYAASKQLCVPAVHSLICVHAEGLASWPLGHVHAPLTRCGVATGQLVHALAPAPLHVTQLESHKAQVEALSA